MRKEFVITNQEGLHARPATALVKKANEFDCDIKITHDGDTADLKSIMGVLSLGVHKGSLIVVETKGKDEVEAMETIAAHISEMKMKSQG